MKRLTPEQAWLIMATIVFIFVVIAILTYPTNAFTDAQTNETETAVQFYPKGEKLGVTDADEPVWEEPWSEPWVITAYCNCVSCCGIWSQYKGLTASGMEIKEGVTIACDQSIPFGTVIEIEGVGERVCMDRGSAIIGNHIDLYFDSHEKACEWGLQERRVRIK